MDPAQNTTNASDQQKPVAATPTVVSASTSKEHEGTSIAAPEVASPVTAEIQLSKEVEKAGVEVVKDTIELPPDVKKLGVTQVGPSAPVTTTATLPQVVLPISDQNVVAGLHMQILSSLRWLAVWCIRRLKKAHIALKNIHGKIIRVKAS